MSSCPSPSVIWTAVLGVLASGQPASWRQGPVEAPVAHEPYRPCDTEVRQILEYRGQLDALRFLAIVLAVAVGVLLCALIALVRSRPGAAYARRRRALGPRLPPHP